MQEEVRAKGLTAKALTVAVIGLILAALLFGDAERAGPWAGFQNAHDPIDFWEWGPTPVLGALGMAWVFIIMIAFLNHGSSAGWWKLRFSSQEVALITMVIVFGGVFNGYYRGPFKEWFSEAAYVARRPVDQQAQLWSLAPPIFGPQDPDFWSFYIGVAGQKARTLSIPWAGLAPMMLTAISFVSCGMLCLFFASMLLRRLYTEVEYLPMPIAEMTTHLVNLTQPRSRKVRLFTSKVFLAGFLLSFIYMFVVQSSSFYQSIITGVAVPRQYGRLGETLLYPIADFTTSAGWIPLYVTLAPWEIGWAMLLPINVLSSAMIGWFAMFVIIPIVLTPYLPPPEPQSGFASFLTHAGELMMGDLGFSYIAIFIGMLVAMVVMPIIRHRRHMGPVFKALFREPPEEFDRDRPISYQLTWLLTIVFGLLWYLIGSFVMQIRYDALLLHMVIVSILYIGGGRLVCETGGYYGNFGNNWHPSLGEYTGTALMKTLNVVPSQGQVTNIMTYYYMGAARYNLYGWGENIPWYSISNMKIANLTRTRTSDVLKACVIGVVVSLISIAVFHYIWRAYSPTIWWKIAGIYFKRATLAEAGQLSNSMLIDRWDTHLTQVIAGFAVVALLSLLQPSVALLRPLSIGGLVFGAWAGSTVWVPWILALVAKYVIIRAGGTKLYERTARPFCLGLVAGALLTLVTMQLGNFLVWLTLGVGR